MIPRARRVLFAGIVASVTAAVGISTLNVASASPDPASDDSLSFTAETFAYPNAAKILKERGIILRKGDGHIILADCSASRDIEVLSTRTDEPNPDRGRFCFKVTGTGKAGYLALEIPKVHHLSTGDFAIHASLTADGKTQEVSVPKYDDASVGEGTKVPGSPTVLVELRVAG